MIRVVCELDLINLQIVIAMSLPIKYFHNTVEYWLSAAKMVAYWDINKKKYWFGQYTVIIMRWALSKFNCITLAGQKRVDIAKNMTTSLTYFKKYWQIWSALKEFECLCSHLAENFWVVMVVDVYKFLKQDKYWVLLFGWYPFFSRK